MDEKESWDSQKKRLGPICFLRESDRKPSGLPSPFSEAILLLRESASRNLRRELAADLLTVLRWIRFSWISLAILPLSSFAAARIKCVKDGEEKTSDAQGGSTTPKVTHGRPPVAVLPWERSINSL
jgi:hypothetical protein